MTGSMSGWPASDSFETFVRDTQRTLAEHGRRTRLPKASQILGPGIAPWAVQLFDWNDPNTLYNGIFYSDVGALSSPDPTKAWIGTSWVTNEGAGIQEVREFGDGIPGGPVWTRTFFTAGGATPVYEAWSSPAALDTDGWVALTHEGTAGTLRYQCASDTVWVEGVLTIALPNNTTTTVLSILNAIPADYRPGLDISMGVGRVEVGSFNCVVTAFDDGTLTARQNTGSPAATLSFRYDYRRG